MPSFAKNRLSRKKQKKHLSSFFQQTKLTQTSGSIFADRIGQTTRTEFELELIKNLDFYLDGHGKYTSNLVSFEIKFF